MTSLLSHCFSLSLVLPFLHGNDKNINGAIFISSGCLIWFWSLPPVSVTAWPSLLMTNKEHEQWCYQHFTRWTSLGFIIWLELGTNVFIQSQPTNLWGGERQGQVKLTRREFPAKIFNSFNDHLNMNIFFLCTSRGVIYKLSESFCIAKSIIFCLTEYQQSPASQWKM